MKIEKPDWSKLLTNEISINTEFELDLWFQENVEPVNQMLEQGVEVYSTSGNHDLLWHVGHGHYSHKALLINIQEIKPKTKEERALELLRWFWDSFDCVGSGYAEQELNIDGLSDKLYETKAILEGE